MTGTDVASFLGAIGGLTSFTWAVRSAITARAERRRTSAEAEERETNTALKPLREVLEAQGALIDDLNTRIDGLRQQLADEREEHAQRIAELRAEIDALRRATT